MTHAKRGMLHTIVMWVWKKCMRRKASELSVANDKAKEQRHWKMNRLGNNKEEIIFCNSWKKGDNDIEKNHCVKLSKDKEIKKTLDWNK